MNVSIVVPTLNEEGNVESLIKRINNSLSQAGIGYEIIFIDDHSSDNTVGLIKLLADTYPVKVFLKQQSRGKAQSLIEGFALTQNELVVMIDADLQYPPEVIPNMVAQIESGTSDIVVANRRAHHTSALRSLASKFNRLMTGGLLHGLECDIQSGLKVFKREIIERVEVNATRWTFDLQFLLEARDAGYRIGSVDIDFNNRSAGESKISFFSSAWEIVSNAFKLKFRKRHILPFSEGMISNHGIGFHYKGKPFVPHTNLPLEETAFFQVTRKQLGVLMMILGFMVLFLALDWKSTLIWILAVLTVLYFIDMLFYFYLVSRSLGRANEIDITEEEITSLGDREWPTYTIFCPLYKEWQVVPQFVDAMQQMDYPKDKLQVQLLLEEDDVTTIRKVKQFDLPDYFEVLVVPHSMPKTKPKACNYGLARATGDYAVIYDAEDIPDTLQLKKAVLAFENSEDNLVCVQAKLHYYNPEYNLLTRFFTLEYSLWFDVILPGLQSVGAPIPLGGTSNHFKTKDLLALNGWDPFNVTEDCDLGMRIVKRGWNTAVVNSTTMEEANSRPWNWVRQRSRWIKGYMQTYLVHTRDLWSFAKWWPKPHILTFNLIVGGIFTLVINPLMWVVTLAYYLFRSQIGEGIEQFFPGPVLYLGTVSLVVGNFFNLYIYMIAAAKRRSWGLVKFVFLIPIYWLGMSWASWIALYEVIVKPHYWAKTIHGFHLGSQEEPDEIEEDVEETVVTPQPSMPEVQDTQAGNSWDWRGHLSGGGALVVASLAGNVLNYMYNSYLARSMSIVEFGTISLIGSLLYIIQLPLGALHRTMSYQSAFGLGKYHEAMYSFWKRLRVRVFVIGLLLSLGWLMFQPMLNGYFNIESATPLLLYTPTLLFSALIAIDSGFLTGMMRFGLLAIFMIVEALSKFLFAWLLVEYGYAEYVYAAIPLSMLLSWSGIYLTLRRLSTSDVDVTSVDTAFDWKFFLSSILEKFSVVAFLSVDVLLAKHFLEPEAAGLYGLLSLVGKMIYFVGSIFGQFIVPLVANMEGSGKRVSGAFYLLMTLISLTTLGGFVVFGLGGAWSVPLLWGNESLRILQYLPMYTLGMAYFAIGSSLVVFHQAKKDYLFPWLSVLAAVGTVVGILLFHNTILEIVHVVSLVSWTFFIVTLSAHIWSVLFGGVKRFESLKNNVIPLLPVRDGMSRILIYNWRDTKHAWSGGAEVYIHNIAKRWVDDGHQVTLFCSNDRKNKSLEMVDGVQVVRRGGFYTLYFWAFWTYITQLRGRYDVVVDCENGIPFFTPLFTRKPVVLLIYHIHQEVFMKHLKLSWWLLPVAFTAKILESSLMPLVYRNTQIVTISDSSKSDIAKIGLGKSLPIEIVYPGIDPIDIVFPKRVAPTILYLGRLQAYKSVDIVIRSLSTIRKTVPNARMIIAGNGEAAGELKSLVSQLGLEDAVEFKGWVTEAEKTELMQSAWVMVQPSRYEGWGITVVEANASGTPVVASDVSGLRESVRPGKTGFLATWGSERAFTNRLLLILGDLSVRNQLRKNAIEWAKNFSWDESSGKFYTVLQKAMAIKASESLSAWQRVVMRTG